LFATREEAVHVLGRAVLAGKDVVERVADLGGEVETTAEVEVVAEAELHAAAEGREVVLVGAGREQRIGVAVDAEVEVTVICARFTRDHRDGESGGGTRERDREDGATCRAGMSHGGRPPGR
jgi:hypothetical protein